MRDKTLGDTLNPWGVALFRTLRTVEPKTAAEQSAYDKWPTRRRCGRRRAETVSTAPKG